ncbi:MAG TPA: ABC transporter substrate-binding protein [Actinopolymorphaceae bacterium]
MTPATRLAPAVRVAGVTLGALALVLAACSAPTEPTASTDTTSGPDGSGSSLVLADPYEDEALNPLLGYGEGGASKIYEGLVGFDAQRRPRPLLAAELPTVSDDGLTWTARLRSGVTFHDGSTFDAEDVEATYDALRDPSRAATVAGDYAMIEDVVATSGDTVEFRLKKPYAPLLAKLTLGIVPSEALATEGTLDSSPLNSEPIGTGPYRLTEWRRGERMELKAYDDYWGTEPEIRNLSVVFVPDDNTRGQRMSNGDFDGAPLPPALADTLGKRDGYTLYAHKSADQRNVMLPMKNPVTGDLAIRRALNHAVDREGMVRAVLSGHGTPASGPIPPVMKEYADPEATFAFDPARARRILDQAGWRPGKDGIRERKGLEARFNLLYPATDSVRKALASAVASDARKIGIDIRLEGLGWEAIQPRMSQDAVLMGGGTPLDPDLLLYGDLHSSLAEDGYNNPGSYANAKVDVALDRARATTDPASRQDAYREVQRELVKDPARVYLVFLEHTYVSRTGWTGYEEVVDPHVHGALGWGPWWNVEKWRRAQ